MAEPTDLPSCICRGVMFLVFDVSSLTDAVSRVNKFKFSVMNGGALDSRLSVLSTKPAAIEFEVSITDWFPYP